MTAYFTRVKDPTKEYQKRLDLIQGKKNTTKISFNDGEAVAAALSRLGGYNE